MASSESRSAASLAARLVHIDARKQRCRAMIRPATVHDIEAIKTLAVDVDMFSSDEVGFVGETVGGSLDGSLDGHRWLVYEDSAGEVVGAAYYAPEPFSDRMWNLYFIAAKPGRQSGGIGSDLIGRVEADLVERGPDIAQVLIVETSSTVQYGRTRAFYPRCGFVEEARIRRFYGPADHKVVFWKSLT